MLLLLNGMPALQASWHSSYSPEAKRVCEQIDETDKKLDAIFEKNGSILSSCCQILDGLYTLNPTKIKAGIESFFSTLTVSRNYYHKIGQEQKKLDALWHQLKKIQEKEGRIKEWNEKKIQEQETEIEKTKEEIKENESNIWGTFVWIFLT